MENMDKKNNNNKIIIKDNDEIEEEIEDEENNNKIHLRGNKKRKIIEKLIVIQITKKMR